MGAEESGDPHMFLGVQLLLRGPGAMSLWVRNVRGILLEGPVDELVVLRIGTILWGATASPFPVGMRDQKVKVH